MEEVNPMTYKGNSAVAASITAICIAATKVATLYLVYRFIGGPKLFTK